MIQEVDQIKTYDASIKVTKKNYVQVSEAYRQGLKNLKEDYWMVAGLENLFIFGFDQFSQKAEANSFPNFQDYKKLYQRFTNFTSIRGHFKKLDFFKDHQVFALYCLKILDYICHYSFYCEDNQFINLYTRAMGLITLFNKEYQAVFLDRFLKHEYMVFGQSESRVFCLYCEKMLKQYGEDIFSETARPLVKQLIELENMKRRASASFTWKTDLGIDLPLNDWLVTIMLDFEQNDGYLYLELQDDSEFNWTLNLTHDSFGRRYREASSFTNSKNESNLPEFSKFGVLKFPDWLKELEKIGYHFDFTNIKISGLRKKADKQKVIQWLMEPFKQ